MKNPKLTLIRGLPGSGKSTLARKLASETGALHLETDMYFTDTSDNYHFDRDVLSIAHAWCWKKTDEALDEKKSVIVSNTFTTMEEIFPYVLIAAKRKVPIEYIKCVGEYGSTKDVPDDILNKMKARWESVHGERVYDGTELQ